MYIDCKNKIMVYFGLKFTNTRQNEAYEISRLLKIIKVYLCFCPCAILNVMCSRVIRELHEVLKSVTHDTNCRVITLKILRTYQKTRLLLIT